MSKPRLLLAALLLANLVYFAWTQGGLAMFGAVPAAFAEHEPQRMTQQIRPGALQIRNEAAAAPAPVPAAPVEPAPAPAASTP
ncbi:sporulation protein [Variovorax fucosicus]|uniref:sporulation protein n=1 Tax=Variovorax fucosicus TaxID=3053517 RepID=UPI00257710C8|nr:sporulation protein [Variovorax sp. J22G47]MDM0054951.1 sporulation protein [Variovorax sp. J22G47]